MRNKMNIRKKWGDDDVKETMKPGDEEDESI